VSRWLALSVNSVYSVLPSGPEEIEAHIVPPEYTGQPSVNLSSPERELFKLRTIDVPEGSTVRVKVSGAKKASVLKVNGQSIAMEPDGEGNYEAAASVSSGRAISLKRGWVTLAYWPVRVIRDMPPSVKFVETPFTVKGALTRMVYDANDDYGVKAVWAKIYPPAPYLPSLEAKPVVIPLASSGLRHSRETEYQDLTFLPWAGSTVEIQLEAQDAAGNTGSSGRIKVSLPKRFFSHPLALTLVEQREKLLRQPDISTRSESAGIMAGIARETANSKGDTLIFMALRTGAVRLVLDQNSEAVRDVSRLMWQAAVRIEDTMSAKEDPPRLQASRGKG